MLPGEILKFHEQLAAVRTELEPWEKHTIDCQGRIDVARSEIKLLKGKVDPIFIFPMLKWKCFWNCLAY